MTPLIEIIAIVSGAVAAIVILISYARFHPAIALGLVSIATGFILGLTWSEVLSTLYHGFLQVITSIGIVIFLGAILGVLMESTGALETLTHLIMRIFGKQRPVTAISVLGFVVGIPVFCDSGFIILSKVAKRLADKKGLKKGMTSVALAGGLYTTHTLIPPTPGPVAAAGNLHLAEHLGIVMITGLLVSLPILAILILASERFFGKREMPDNPMEVDSSKRFNWPLLLPMIVAIVMIAGGSIALMIDKDSQTAITIAKLADPKVALLIACLIAVFQLPKENTVMDRLQSGTGQALPIILITAAGGAFGQVLKQSELTSILSDTLTVQSGGYAIALLVLTYLLAVVIKSAQGSSTAALVITSSIIFPLTAQYDLSVWQLSILVSTIGVGAMAISHINDSYFWVVTRLTGLSVREGYRYYSVMTIVMSLTGFAICVALFFVL